MLWMLVIFEYIARYSKVVDGDVKAPTICNASIREVTCSECLLEHIGAMNCREFMANFSYAPMKGLHNVPYHSLVVLR